MTIQIKRGDILLYYKPKNVLEELVQIGEMFEDGKMRKEYFHVAISIDDKFKIETNGTRVHDNPIDYTEPFDIIRFPLNEKDIEFAVMYIESFIGQKYDWTLIVDDTLRYLSRNYFHLPESWVVERENTEKICTTFTEKYLDKLGYGTSKGLHESPEDFYLDFKQYLVKENE